MIHQPIQDSLEDYLSGKASPDRVKGFHAHLAECEECRNLVTAFQSQSRMIQVLRPPTQVSESLLEPSPGFYARVMARIESQESNSVWSLFLEPVFGKRLAFASMALFVLLASVAYTTNDSSPVRAGMRTPEGILAVHDIEYPPAPGVDIQRDRDIVLTHLASYGDSEPMEPVPMAIPVRSE
jgi:hypothetical protein